MNYNKESLRNALAAEYVLGTLRGKARKRFQRLMYSNQSIAEAVWTWEQHLNGMAETIEPATPDPKVWRNIEQQLRFDQKTDNVVKASFVKRAVSHVSWLAIAASILVVFTLSIVRNQPTVDQMTQFAVVNNEVSEPLWLIEITQERLKAKPTDRLVRKTDNDYELWIVPTSGDAPVSLGVLPQLAAMNKVAPSALVSIPFNVLAVSLEPLGGSPNGQPTEVLFTTNVNNV